MPQDPVAMKKLGAIVFCVLCVGALGYQVFKSDDEIEAVPDTIEDGTPWGCYNCGHAQMFTPRERVKLQQGGSTVTIGGKAMSDKTADAAGRGSFRDTTLRCPSCREMEMRKAATCPECKTIYSVEFRGDKQVCPKCDPEQLKKYSKRKAGRRRSRRP